MIVTQSNLTIEKRFQLSTDASYCRIPMRLGHFRTIKAHNGHHVDVRREDFLGDVKSEIITSIHFQMRDSWIKIANIDDVIFTKCETTEFQFAQCCAILN